jgi:hypothetical protein
VSNLKERINEAKSLGLVRVDAHEFLVIYDSTTLFREPDYKHPIDHWKPQSSGAISPKKASRAAPVHTLDGKLKRLATRIAGTISCWSLLSSSRSGILPQGELSR